MFIPPRRSEALCSKPLPSLRIFAPLRRVSSFTGLYLSLGLFLISQLLVVGRRGHVFGLWAGCPTLVIVDVPPPVLFLVAGSEAHFDSEVDC